MTQKSFWKTILPAIALMFFQINSVFSQSVQKTIVPQYLNKEFRITAPQKYVYRDLGLITYKDLLTDLAFLGAGVVIALSIKTPEPELHFKKSDFVNNLDGSSMNHNYSVNKLKEFSRIYLIKQRSPRRTDYGLIRSITEKGFVVETRKDSLVVSYLNLKEIMDLNSAAKRSKARRFKFGYISLGSALGSFYMATKNRQYRSSNWLTFAISAALSAYKFLRKSEAEKEYEIWVEEYDIELISKKFPY